MCASPRILLAIDTSTRNVGVALYDGAQVLVEFAWQSADFHTVELAPTVEDALRRVKIDPPQIGAFGVALGPGSFTGLRVGLAFAKGMALAHRLPLVGVRTLDFLAAAQPIQETPLIAVLRAGRGRLAAGWYTAKNQAWQPAQEIEICTLPELIEKIDQPVAVCGELSTEEREQLSQARPEAKLASPAFCLRRAGFLAEVAWRRWKTSQTDDPAALAPIYLHYGEPVPE
ncbi:MAG: tRNA (adenosine(37)-N6)-threonylcarbamoyltransferase complex dimerization subunit type 1 TsaB [Anaerolineae bacterium UTCFX2]|jgi:tRNA threonylcarbamoyladenosine biosynthesis protein TsaB|nr:tRNA (adenosine(37)-N6)-threonylcarbamoyltransferase complex dimerization subunit type 1 TsaB [Anaerolineae bacterium]MCZ7552353.1 tRNA (adenosine(37)-N6)-threonylcarbamoyltransferase complex dimerization subunit type 1 TsaB [Anaerolineales bacterium]OQY91850.1 MAG: tRNA (adenosine(37)-N6)-threonylcarbamoyltransferase complex dimerization subunit type 1 TsaB [Anaerolineae bacterium UTCFX2]